MSDDTITTRTAIAFEKWRVPNFACVAQDPSLAQRSEGGTAIRIENLDGVALDDLAAEWLADLYAKAGKACPFQRKPL